MLFGGIHLPLRAKITIKDLTLNGVRLRSCFKQHLRTNYKGEQSDQASNVGWRFQFCRSCKYNGKRRESKAKATEIQERCFLFSVEAGRAGPGGHAAAAGLTTFSGVGKIANGSTNFDLTDHRSDQQQQQ